VTCGVSRSRVHQEKHFGPGTCQVVTKRHGGSEWLWDTLGVCRGVSGYTPYLNPLWTQRFNIICILLYIQWWLSFFGLFSTHSLSCNNSLSSFVPKLRNPLFISATATHFSHTVWLCCTTSCLYVSRCITFLTSFKVVKSSLSSWRSLSDDVTCKARVFRMDFVSRRQKHI